MLGSTPALNSPPPRLCAFRGEVPPLAAICSAAIAHAAQDSTQLFLSLLPKDLRTQVELLYRAVAWHHTGELVSVPDVVLLRENSRMTRVLSAEGEEVMLTTHYPLSGDPVRRRLDILAVCVC